MTIVQRRQREKERRRDDIVGAAESLFFAKGYENVTMDEIAKKVELSRPTIYLYFENKESLYLFIVVRGLKRLSEIVQKKVKGKKKGIDGVRCIWNAYMEFAEECPDHYMAYQYFLHGSFGLDRMMLVDPLGNMDMYGKRPVAPSQGQVVVNLPYAAQITDIISIHRDIFEILCDQIGNGIDDGSIRRDVVPGEIATIFLLLAEHGGILNSIYKIELASKLISPQKMRNSIMDNLDIQNG